MRTIVVLALLVFVPTFAYAATVNINTADVTLLETLSGIGPSKAAAIITYRTQHGPFAQIDDIQNVSGIGPATFAGIKDFIAVGDTVSNTSNTVDASTTAGTAAAVSSSGGSSSYTPPPSSLLVAISGNTDALLEVPLRLSAQVTTKSGAADPSANVTWSFGDGSSASGNSVEKIYHYAGAYIIKVRATDAATTAQNQIVVTVKPSAVRISAATGDGITITNDSNAQLDLSGWRIYTSTGTFRIPDGMTVLPNATVLLPYTVMNLPVAFDATLSYPTGIFATRYLPPSASIASTTATTTTAGSIASVVQPSASADGSTNRVQKVTMVPTTNLSGTAHGIQQVNAPAVTTEIVTAGAALPGAATAFMSTAAKLGMPGLMHSPWALSLLSVVALAGGAFIFL